jgi:hypothetical protein
METCSECGTEFDIADERSEYNAHFGGDLDYDEDAGGGTCAGCAIAIAESNIDLGRAIDMMNGDEDYDDDFVTQNL